MSSGIRIPLTKEELFALSEFFNGDGDMDNNMFADIGKKLLVTAAINGCYDELLDQE